jgi:hypothetical protein
MAPGMCLTNTPSVSIWLALEQSCLRSGFVAPHSNQLDRQQSIEGLVFDYALGRISARIGHDAGIADTVVEASG